MSEKTDFTAAVDELDRSSDVEARKHFDENRRLSAFAAARASVSAFRKVYFIENARKQGVPGLFRAVNAGMFHFLTYAKHWELQRNARSGV